jgi:hypothetical protein
MEKCLISVVEIPDNLDADCRIFSSEVASSGNNSNMISLNDNLLLLLAKVMNKRWFERKLDIIVLQRRVWIVFALNSGSGMIG